MGESHALVGGESHALVGALVGGTGADGDSVQSDFFEEESPAERTGPIDMPYGVLEDNDRDAAPPVTPEAAERGVPILESADEPAYEPADQPLYEPKEC